MAAAFNDHFSACAAAYAEARPDYPAELFDWLAAQSPQRICAVDVGCGNGQAAVALGRHFEQVRAFDPSAAQLASVRAHPRVSYALAPAECLPLPAASVDLLMVAQALHWFDFPRFFAEVQRVLKPDGRFCAVHYPLLRVAPWIDRQIESFERSIVGPYWPPERRHIDNAFCELQFPFIRRATPDFTMFRQWNLPRLLDYLRTWSAVQRFQQARGTDPVLPLEQQLRPLWGDPAEERQICWPLLVWFGVHHHASPQPAAGYAASKTAADDPL
jgi:SAM-dependent methyltransferase